MTGTARCTVVLPADAPRTTASRVVVEIRDVSIADAPSTVVGERVLDSVALVPGGRLSPVDVPVRAGGSTPVLAVRVHVDLTGTGTITPGDLLTTVHVPVLTGGAPAAVLVPVTVV